VDPDLPAVLFRRESGRLVAALTRVFGVANLALAEDVVQDAFCRALEVWKHTGVPDNPAAWLMAAAKNRALDVIRRERTATAYAPEMGRWLQTEWTAAPAIDEAFAGEAIRDEQLRMIFSCCHPRLPEEAQIVLVLHILCGFSTAEIAAALLSGYAGIEKRLSRGKKALAASKRLFDLRDADFDDRLSSVHRALYLLFNEGYHGAGAESSVQADLCREAMRLTGLLRESPRTGTPTTTALAALMALHAARLPARLDTVGELSPFAEQDRARWDQRLLREGLELLEASAVGETLSPYHVEAAIAAVHATAERADDTDWETVVELYDRLMVLRPSPVVALNRAVAVAQLEGAEHGLAEIAGIEDVERLARYPFYPAAIAELEMRLGRVADARGHFLRAMELARNPMERRYIERRLDACGPSR